MCVEPSDVGNGPYSPAGELSCDDFARIYLVNERLSEGRSRGRDVYAGLRWADEKQVAIEYVPRNQFITSGTRRLPLEVVLREKVNRPYRCENVVELLNWVETPNHVILVLERSSSCMNLQAFRSRYIQQSGQLPEDRVRKIMYQVFRGVHHFFECGVLYLDFDPVNLLINLETWEVKLNDFGCSRFLMNESYSSYTGAPDFCPPEWLIPENYWSATVWKLGELIHWLMFGDYPFKSMGDWQLHYPFNVEVSGDCLSLISGCLKQDPEERLQFNQIPDHMWFRA